MEAKDYMTLAGLGCTLLAVGIAVSAPAWAHPGVDLQILDLDARIKNQEDNAALYLRRGELHRLHRDWTAAEADYKKARQLDATLIEVDFCLGKMKLEAEQPGEARVALDRFLTQQPQHIGALATRARARSKTGDHLGAARDFSAALAVAKEDPAMPAYYLERARALAAAGNDHLAAAVRGLDEGIERLGAPITLQLYAIDLEVERSNHDAALVRIKTIAERSRRKETWFVRQAEILEHAGRATQARQAYEHALEAIQSLPISRRNNRAVQELETEARDALARLP